MPAESAAEKLKRTSLIIARLREAYPQAHCELVHSSPLQLLIATILSAQCTDKKVNSVTPHLFRSFPTAESLAAAKTPELEEIIRPLGFFRNKARAIQGCCQMLAAQYGGKVPSTMEELTALLGVGRKTANVVLGNAFGIQAGIVVDTHVARLSQRLRLSRNVDPVKIEQDLLRLVPQDYWTLFSHLLIWHGRRRCFARNPDCLHCEVLNWCPTGRKRVSTPAPPQRPESATPFKSRRPVR